MKDVKHNTVYYVDWLGTKYIVLYDETRLAEDHYIRIEGKTYASNAHFSSHKDFLNYLSSPTRGIRIREADYIEEKWLRSCMEAKMYVECPKDVTINSYAIY